MSHHHHHHYKQHTGLLSAWVDGIRTRKISSFIKPTESVLDVGCGSALLLGALSKSNSYVGIDRDAEVVEHNRHRFPTAQFEQVDVCNQSLPFSNHQFDVVTMGAFLEHVDNAGAFFSEIVRVLKKGGRIIATTPSALGMMTHEVLSSMRLLSHDAAEEHKGAFTHESWAPILSQQDLQILVSKKFELGMNQLFILKRGNS